MGDASVWLMVTRRRPDSWPPLRRVTHLLASFWDSSERPNSAGEDGHSGANVSIVGYG